MVASDQPPRSWPQRGGIASSFGGDWLRPGVPGQDVGDRPRACMIKAKTSGAVRWCRGTLTGEVFVSHAEPSWVLQGLVVPGPGGVE
jgi:hypothetical protein